MRELIDVQMEALAQSMRLNGAIMAKVREQLRQLPCIPLDDIEWDDEGEAAPQFSLDSSSSIIQPLSISEPRTLTRSDSNSSLSSSASSATRKEGSKGLICLGKWYQRHHTSNNAHADLDAKSDSNAATSTNTQANITIGGAQSSATTANNHTNGNASASNATDILYPNSINDHNNNHTNANTNTNTDTDTNEGSYSEMQLPVVRIACKKLKQVRKRAHFHKEIAAQMLLACIFYN